MNRKALYFGIAYSILIIVLKLFILFAGYSLVRPVFLFGHITSVLLIIPFFVFAIKSVRDKDYGGIIGGREAARIGLTIFAVSAVILSIYNYFEFEYSGKAMAIAYYNSEEFMTFLKAQPKIKPEDYTKIITEQIATSEKSAFKATTGKLFPFMFIGLSAAFITSAIMKRSSKK